MAGNTILTNNKKLIQTAALTPQPLDLYSEGDGFESRAGHRLV